MQFYNDKRKYVNMKLFGDIYVFFALQHSSIPTENYPIAEAHSILSS
jgi:hypothetical protein